MEHNSYQQMDCRITIPSFKFKDYAYQKNNRIHCSFKYVALLYDQICDCTDESEFVGSGGMPPTCQGDLPSIGFVNLGIDRFKTVLEDVAFEMDSSSKREGEANGIAKQLLVVLKDWCRKITKVKLNWEYVCRGELTKYNQHVYELIRKIRLHPDVPPEKFLNLKHLLMDFEVVLTDITYAEVNDIGMNLYHINFLIYNYLKDTYPTCGLYLSNTRISPEELPFHGSPEKVTSAYCHLYLVPLNLKSHYLGDAATL